jgi:4-amino-4-deoxy-L-arabinose transferase-like glycosyltransferase
MPPRTIAHKQKINHPSTEPRSETFSISAKKSIRNLTIKLRVPWASRFRVNLEGVSSEGKIISSRKWLIRQPKVREPGSSIFSRMANCLASMFQAGTWSLERILFILAILLYTVVHLVKLDAFPIYFFTDEAVQTMLATDMLRDNGKNYDGEFLPTYFVNGNQYNLSTSVYLQVLPVFLFNRSIEVTRGTAGLATLLAAFAVGLTLKRIFKSRYSWAATLLLLITPAWFLHSRTAFETTLAVSFFAAFIYFYLLYRTGNPKNLYLAMVMGALCFYSYSPAQMVMAVSAFLLLFSDIRYHWQNRKIFFGAVGVGVLLALPYLRYLLAHPDENYRHMVILRSYWISDISFLDKLKRFGFNWLKGLNPAYWFIPNNVDFVRHLMKGYGNLFRLSFPFLLFGLGVALRFIKSSPHRALILLLIAAPSGAALVDLGITRGLFLAIPAVLLSSVGLNSVLAWLEKKRVPFSLLAILLFVALAGTGIWMLADALINGPTWFSDYGLGGMQYGAEQLFKKVNSYLREHPDAKLVVSPSWANGTEVLSRFFLLDPRYAELGSIGTYLNEYKEIQPGTEFVMIPEEFDEASASPKFTDIQVDDIIPYPNGQPGFYFVHLRYSEDAENLFMAETAMRRMPIEGATLLPDGQVITVSYSRLDMGKLTDLFDGDPYTVTRTDTANPFQINVTFPEATLVNGMFIRVGGTPTRVTLELVTLGNDAPFYFEQEKGETADPRDLVLNFGTTLPILEAHIQVLSFNDKEPTHVHVWEVTFIKP